MEPAKVATGAAVFISFSAIFIALYTTCQIYNEVTEMYNENMVDINEFNVRDDVIFQKSFFIESNQHSLD